MIIDINNDGEIQISEAENVRYLNVSSEDISSLTGIERFINLTELRCSSNDLNSLNLSSNTNLINIKCSYNDLTNLVIGNNTNLNYLSCRGNELTSLNLNNCTNLSVLKCRSNNLSSINLDNCINLTELECRSNNLTNLDLSDAVNLIELICYANSLAVLDLSNNINLTELHCSNNNLNIINTDNNPNLEKLLCGKNPLILLDLSNNPNLYKLYCSDDNFDHQSTMTSLDLSQNPNLTHLRFQDHYNVEHINLNNGNNDNIILTGTSQLMFTGLNNLQTVCVDELNTDLTNHIDGEVGQSVTFLENCSFYINGVVIIDTDNNGCDSNDITVNNVPIIADNGVKSFKTFTQNDGTYFISTNEGDYITTLILPSYWSYTPTEYTNTFTGFGDTFTADFCITPNQNINDISITLVPTSQASPGFDTSYRIVYKNIGTTQINGSVSLDFDETKLSFLNSSETIDSQTTNSLTFNYTALNPFETRIIDLEFNINTPTAAQPVNNGDILNFTTTVTPISGDYTPDDNVFTLNQTVIGSYDPNDITCLEGDEVLLADTDKYLHYVVRFQNSGTASAINIVVKNILDAKLDWSTLQLETTSHNSRVAITNGNEIEFIFENINLPDENTNESGSHGFIAYKIKPKANVAIGDVISNEADIFLIIMSLLKQTQQQLQ
ncbi:MAG: T9SS C-terminal target domain-containing protein [Flavobacteriaceae bacterium]